jgi:hypothetical protein
MSPKNGNDPTPKEWTVMFFCAGDNELAPLIVSQLKGIKDAGSHDDVDVLVYVDPNEKGVPTRVYLVNQNGAPRNQSNNPFILNFEPDNLKLNGTEGAAAIKLKEVLDAPDSVDVNESLKRFLLYCKEKHQAKNYALILLGHGMIVANDAFLPDESPVSSITLNELGSALEKFGGILTCWPCIVAR